MGLVAAGGLALSRLEVEAPAAAERPEERVQLGVEAAEESRGPIHQLLGVPEWPKRRATLDIYGKVPGP